MTDAAMRKTGLWLYLAWLFSYLFLWMLVGNQADMDVWGKMAIGALWHQTGAFPSHDVFSYTAPGASWVDHEWGAGVIFYWLFLGFGSAGLFWLKAVLLALLLAIVGAGYLEGNREKAGSAWDPRRLVLFLVAAFSLYFPLRVGFQMTLRAQVFSYLLYVLVLWLLEQFRLGTRPRRVWVVPVLMGLWANLHGGFLYGFGLLGFYLIWVLVDRRVRDARTLGLVFVLSLAATFLNPYGLDFPGAMLAAWIHPRGMILEWQSVFEQYAGIYALYYAAILVFWIALGFSGWRRDRRRFPGALLLILVTGLEGLLHQKLMPFFACTAAILGPRMDLPSLPTFEVVEPFRRRFLWGALIVVPALGTTLTAAFSVWQARGVEHKFGVLVSGTTMKQEYPVDAARFLQANGIRGNLWCNFRCGEFLFWVLYPDVKVSVDGRYEAVYPETVMRDSFAFFAHPTAVDRPLRYPTTHLLISRYSRDLIACVDAHPRWTAIFEDDKYKLYALDFPPGPPVRMDSSKTVYVDFFLGDLSRFRGAKTSR